jgi:hypothetical protein
MRNQLTKEHSAKKFCPFLSKPFDECYCVKMDSQNVERTVYFCGNNFETCEIYKNVNNEKTLKKKRI